MKKISLFDLFVGIILVLFVAVIILAGKSKEPIPSTVLLVTIVVTNPEANVIYDTAKNQNEVYLNSIDEEVKVETVKINPQSQLEVKVSAPGKIEKGKIIFNGQRILIGQKAEIHSSYFAQGYIKDVHLLNN